MSDDTEDMTETESHDAESYAEAEPDGIFIEVDEGDPFERVELHVRTDDGVGIKIGGMDTEPGRYELTKVSD